MKQARLLPLCVLASAAIASIPSGARANSVTGSSTAIAVDAPGAVAGADPDNVPCTGTATNCAGTATVFGVHTDASITTTVGLNVTPAFTIGNTTLVPPTLSPSIQFQGNVSATRTQSAVTSAGASGTATWTAQGTAASVISGVSIPQPGTLLSGALTWDVPFTLAQSNLTTLYSFSFSATGVPPSSNNPLTVAKTFNMQCNGTSCSISGGNANTVSTKFNSQPGATQFLSFVMLLDQLSSNALTLSETVQFQTGASAGTGDQFNFSDPLQLSYLDPTGAVVPDLVFFDSDLNAVIPLSGQDFSGTSATPIPAALPLFATGLGGLGLLGWRRKRKAQAGA
jgi:hypothetical protein